MHIGVLIVNGSAALTFVLFALISQFNNAQAVSAAIWNMDTAADYTYDDTKIEAIGGVAQLKAAANPGTDWIAADGSSNNWGLRKTITLDNRTSFLGVTSEALTNFPILVKLDSTNIDYSKTQNSGQDLRFTDSDGVTPLKYEIEKWDESGTSFVWVKVPQIDINSNTDYINMYYGNSTVADGQDATNVWDSNFSMVHHFEETDIDGGAGDIKDSTVNANNGTTSMMNSADQIVGKINGGFDFSGASDYVTIIKPTTLTSYSIELWYYMNASTGWRSFIGGGPYEYLMDVATNKINAYSCGQLLSTTVLENSRWYHIVLTHNTSGSKLYIDGAVNATNTNPSGAISNQSIKIGVYQSGSQDLNGKLDEFRISSSVRTAGWIAASHKSEYDDSFRSFGVETGIYSNEIPAITPKSGQGYSQLSSFTQSLGSGSTGTIKYQISPDNGTSWYWWNGSAWTSTVAGTTEANIATDIDSHISAFTVGSQPKTFKWKAYLNSDGLQQPKLDAVSISYTWDTGAPNNVTALTAAKSKTSDGVNLTVSDGSRWYNYANPHFEWATPDDNANDGETISGIASYDICFDTNATCNTDTEGTSQTANDYTASNLVSSNTYYLRIRTKDNAGNYSVDEDQLFVYKYDADRPTTPQYVSASPAGFSRTKDYSFIWPTANSAAADDEGSSLLRGYQYRINDDTTWYGPNRTGDEDDVIPSGTGTITLTADDGVLITTGTNIFYLRTVDNAGNASSAVIQVPFYYNNDAPPAPTVVNVSPVYNTENNFSFSWSAIEGWAGGIAKYYYSVNDPDFSQKNSTTLTHLDNQAAATKQSPLKNRFCVVAEDSAGNVNFENPTCVDFTADTPAPGMITKLLVNDQSIRAEAYKTSLSWSAPTEVGIGVHHYNIYRQNGSEEFALLASPTDRYYLDETVSPGIEYSYKVRAVDSADKESADSTVIAIIPRGKYVSAALITSGSIKVATTSRTANISWQTETNRDPFTNEIHTTDSMVAYGKTEALESTAADREFSFNHNIELKNLEPDTIYYYQVLGVDENGNRTMGNVLTFQTAKPTVISKVELVDLRQTTAVLKWESSRITTTEILYGKSTAYGITYKEGDIPNATTHTVFLKDLEAGTQYHFQIQGVDEYGDIVKSDNYTLLKTLEYPKITDVTFQPMTKAAITTIEVNWTTNIPTDGRVSYATTDGSDWREEYDGEFKTAHKFTIGGGKLMDKKTYLFKALVRDKYGNEVVSETQTYTTPEDTRAPVLTNLQTEVSVEGSGDTAQVSAVITWDTDEPADSQVFYGEGASGDASNSTGKDGTLVTSHLVVISNLKPAQTYHIKAKSSDKSGNLTESNNQNFVTNQAAQSVINIILTRLQQVFGWMGK